MTTITPNTKDEAISFLESEAKYFWDQCQWGFHPDDSARGYVNRDGKPSFTAAECAAFDARRMECFRVADEFGLDIYGVMMDEFRRIEGSQPFDFVNAAENFYDAAARLSNAWAEQGVDQNRAAENYPFAESFEEVLAKIGIWLQTQQQKRVAQ